ncbi:hypothetical protein ABPG72_007991 [Tetrahymena utriculariae]
MRLIIAELLQQSIKILILKNCNLFIKNASLVLLQITILSHVLKDHLYLMSLYSYCKRLDRKRECDEGYTSLQIDQNQLFVRENPFQYDPRCSKIDTINKICISPRFPYTLDISQDKIIQIPRSYCKLINDGVCIQNYETFFQIQCLQYFIYSPNGCIPLKFNCLKNNGITCTCADGEAIDSAGSICQYYQNCQVFGYAGQLQFCIECLSGYSNSQGQCIQQSSSPSPNQTGPQFSSKTFISDFKCSEGYQLNDKTIDNLQTILLAINPSIPKNKSDPLYLLLLSHAVVLAQSEPYSSNQCVQGSVEVMHGIQCVWRLLTVLRLIFSIKRQMNSYGKKLLKLEQKCNLSYQGIDCIKCFKNVRLDKQYSCKQGEGWSQTFQRCLPQCFNGMLKFKENQCTQRRICDKQYDNKLKLFICPDCSLVNALTKCQIYQNCFQMNYIHINTQHVWLNADGLDWNFQYQKCVYLQKNQEKNVNQKIHSKRKAIREIETVQQDIKLGKLNQKSQQDIKINENNIQQNILEQPIHEQTIYLMEQQNNQENELQQEKEQSVQQLNLENLTNKNNTQIKQVQKTERKKMKQSKLKKKFQ